MELLFYFFHFLDQYCIFSAEQEELVKIAPGDLKASKLNFLPITVPRPNQSRQRSIICDKIAIFALAARMWGLNSWQPQSPTM